MDYEFVKRFEGKYVKLVLYPNFVLDGTIIEAGDTSLVFETEQGSSVISLDSIKELMEKSK